MSKYLFWFLLFSSMFISSCMQQDNNRVKVDGGCIEGSINTLGDVRIFKGIPFAAPPIGNLRWKAPQAVQPWEGVRKCDTFGASPVQSPPAPFMFWSSEFLIPKEPIGEDCLYLNVWTPIELTTEKLPVLVYVYGGGFRSGGSGCPIYDGEAMARKGVVFVTFNYRVGVFGFLSHPELSQESTYRTSGNYGLLDMIAALQWVKKNIAAFGGDPDNVTIAGQSAGAFGVNYLTASPLSKGLFHRAIAQSGGSFYANPMRSARDLAAAEQQGIEFAAAWNSAGINELRAKPAEEILKAQGGTAWPIVDGYVIPESIYATYAQGKQHDVPTIVGWNQDDKLMLQAQPAEVFRERIRERFGDWSEDFFQVYPAYTEEEAAQSQFNLSRDETFGVQGYTWAKMQNQTGRSSIFVYNFNRKLPAYTPETQFGAFHSGEIVYAYNNLHTLDRPWEETDHKIADIMSSYWVNFARTGDPNGENLPVWKPYNAEQQQVMIFDERSQTKPLPTQEQMRFLEGYLMANQHRE